MTNPFVRQHLESNRQNRDAWDRYAPHRTRVTTLVMEALPPNGRLCVIGAGNVNDVDLGLVLTRASSVDLVDLDGDAMVEGIRRQRLDGDSRISLHPRWDLSGVLHLLGQETDAGRLVAAIDRHGRPADLAAGGFDVVLSVGVLTQAFQSVVDAALDPAATVAVTLRIRDHHLIDLTELTRPGGRAVLVTDTVATSTAPHLVNLPEGGLEPAMAELVAGGNFFTGTNAYRVVAVLEESEGLAGRVADVTLPDPWLWAVTPDRQHLTYAITWRRRQ